MNEVLGKHSRGILGEQLNERIDSLKGQIDRYQRLQTQLAMERKLITTNIEVVNDILETTGHKSTDFVDLGRYRISDINNLLEQAEELVSTPESELVVC